MMAQLTFYIYYAARSLARSGQRTVLALACIAFGVMSLVAMQSVAEVFTGIFLRDPRTALGGDALLQQPGYSADSKSDHPSQEFTAAQLAQLEQWRSDGTIAAYSLIAESQGGLLKLEGASRVQLLYSSLGVDPATYPLVGQVQLADPNMTLAEALPTSGSAAITRDLASLLALRVGSRFTLDIGSGALPQVLQVTAIIDSMPDRRGNAVLYNLDTARQLTGFKEVANQATVLWGAHGNVASMLSGAGWYVFTAERLQKALGTDNTVQVFTFMLKGAGILGLLIGGIGVANTMQVLLARRTLELAILKTHGFRQPDLWALFGVETALLGLLGSLLGAVLALAASTALVSLVQQLISDTGAWQIDPWIMIGGALAGVATTVIFGLEAVVRASVVRPAVLLRNLPEPRGWQANLLGLGLYGVLGLAFLAVSSLIMGSVVLGLEVIGGALAGLVVLGLAFSVVFFILLRIPLPGQSLLALARNSLKRSRLRSLFALIALFAGVFAINFSTMALASAVKRAADRQIAATGDNVWVYGQPGDGPGIEAAMTAQGVQNIRTSYQVPIQISQADSANGLVNLALSGHTPDANGQEFKLVNGTQWDTAPEAAFLPSNLANVPWSLKPGGSVTIKLSNGQQQALKVAGFYDSGPNSIILPPQGIVVNEATALKLGGSETQVSYIGQSPVEHLSEVTQALGAALPNAMVVSKADVANRLNGFYNSLVKLVFAVAGLALVAGGVLIANAVGLAMVERRRELGILKAVGYTSGNVLQTILLENGLLGLMAGAGGTLATALAVPILNKIQPSLNMQFDLPLGVLMAGVAVLLALLSAGLVAWQPTRVRPLEVLRTE